MFAMWMRRSVVTGNKHTEAVKETVKVKMQRSYMISAAIESEIATLESFDDSQLFLEDLGLHESGVTRLDHVNLPLIKSGYLFHRR